jgi:hypothetical protein
MRYSVLGNVQTSKHSRPPAFHFARIPSFIKRLGSPAILTESQLLGPLVCARRSLRPCQPRLPSEPRGHSRVPLWLGGRVAEPPRSSRPQAAPINKYGRRRDHWVNQCTSPLSQRATTTPRAGTPRISPLGGRPGKRDVGRNQYGRGLLCIQMRPNSFLTAAMIVSPHTITATSISHRTHSNVYDQQPCHYLLTSSPHSTMTYQPIKKEVIDVNLFLAHQHILP